MNFFEALLRIHVIRSVNIIFLTIILSITESGTTSGGMRQKYWKIAAIKKGSTVYIF